MSLAGRSQQGSTSTKSRRALAAIDGVEAIHDLHIWPLSTTETALTAHIVTARADYPDALLRDARGPCCTTAFTSNIARIQVERTPSRPHAIVDAMNVTHLECSLTGERYEAGQVHNLSRSGQAAARSLRSRRGEADADAREPCGREPGMWKWRELLPHDGRAGQPGRAGNADRRACQDRGCEGASNLLVKDEGRLADRLVQGARAGDGGDDGEAVRDRADRNADQRQCRRGARRLWRAGGDRDDRHLPGRNAGDQRHRDRGLWRARLCRRRPDRRMRGAGRKGRGAKGCGSTARRSRNPTASKARR